MINIIEPFSEDKNLGKAYNKMCALIPDDEWICIKDCDTLFLTPDAPNILLGYAKRNPDCLLTCYTNRIHPNSPQLYAGHMNSVDSVKFHIETAIKLKENSFETKEVGRTISGFLLLFPKTLWIKYPFTEDRKCLGVDSDWSHRLNVSGVKIKIMTGLYVWHTYRLLQGQEYKSHLL